MVPLQRPDEMHTPSPSWMQTTSGYEDMYSELGIPTMITWSYDGKEVAVEGSWDNWKTRFGMSGMCLLMFFLFVCLLSFSVDMFFSRHLVVFSSFHLQVLESWNQKNKVAILNYY